MQPTRPQPQRAPPSFTHTWPISPAARRPSHGLPSSTIPPPTDPHAHAAAPAGGAAPEPRLAVEHEPAAHAGAPEHAQQRGVRLGGTELELGVDRDLHVVAECERRTELALEHLAHVERAG